MPYGRKRFPNPLHFSIVPQYGVKRSGDTTIPHARGVSEGKGLSVGRRSFRVALPGIFSGDHSSAGKLGISLFFCGGGKIKKASQFPGPDLDGNIIILTPVEPHTNLQATGGEPSPHTLVIRI